MAFFALSPLQRIFEGAIGGTISGIKHGVTSSFTRLGPKGMGNRLKSLGRDAWHGETRRSLRENGEFWKDFGTRFSNAGAFGKTMGAMGVPIRAGLSAADVAVGVGSDVLGLAAGAIGSVAGIAMRSGAQATGVGALLAATGAAKAGIAAAPTIGRAAWGTAKFGAHSAAYLAGGAVRAGAGAAGAIWHTRKNPMVGTMLGAGAITGGLAYGSSKTEMRASMGVIGAHAPAYSITPEAANPGQAQYSNMKPHRQMDNFGASGDLVFALNNLRGGGVL